jgi:hemerythrin
MSRRPSRTLRRNNAILEESMRPSPNRVAENASLAALRHVNKALRTRLRNIQRSTDCEFAASFAGTVAAVEAGFRHEEAILESRNAPQLHERRAENAMILCSLHRISVRVEQGQTELGRQLAAALEDMLAPHRLSILKAWDDAAFPRHRSSRKRHLRPLH